MMIYKNGKNTLDDRIFVDAEKGGKTWVVTTSHVRDESGRLESCVVIESGIPSREKALAHACDRRRKARAAVASLCKS